MGGLTSAASKTNASGGISPEQQALAQYTFGESVIGDRQQFAGQGMGPSTSETQAVGGSRFGEAQQAAQMSDADYQAMVAYNQQQINSLTQAASGAGSLLGGLGGGGGK
jgi:hypothetical protein